MIALTIEQGSAEWFAARLGIPTASNFDKIVTSKGEPSKSAIKYLYQLAGERVSGKSEEGFQSAAMLRGVEVEAEAREFYELIREVEVQRVGFCFYGEDRRFGCSPDSLVGEDGMLEIKCPIMSTHVGYLVENKLPTDYVQQVQGQLFVTGRKWCDFLSYYPGLKPLIVRVIRDEEFIKKLDSALVSFCEELETVVKKIQ